MDTTHILVAAEVVYADLRILVGGYAGKGEADGEEAEAGHLGRVENQ